MQRIILLSILSLFGFSKGQFTTHPMASIGYSYQNQSLLDIGSKILFLKKDEIAYRIGAYATIGQINNKTTVLPKIQGDILFNFRENVDVTQGFYYIIGAETTHKFFSPYLGISALGIIDFTSGYALPYQKVNGKELKGINFNLKFNIPLSVFQK